MACGPQRPRGCTLSTPNKKKNTKFKNKGINTFPNQALIVQLFLLGYVQDIQLPHASRGPLRSTTTEVGQMKQSSFLCPIRVHQTFS